MKRTFLFAAGYAVLAAIAEPVPIPSGATTPQWPKPLIVSLASGSASVRSKDLEVVHSADTLGDFVVRVSGRDFAIGQNQPVFGYLIEGKLRWFELSGAKDKQIKVTPERGSVTCRWEGLDPDGARWKLEYQFRPGPLPGSID